nr:hypothetical protein GCM10020063_010130 [Dactylosporangium thailandense]
MRADLRSSDDRRMLGAMDELFVHDQLIRRYRVTYEEGEGTRPDFRVYAGAAYVGAVEVATLFLRDDWAAEERRNAGLKQQLNQRLPLTTHSVEFEIFRWDAAPRLQPMVKWIERTLDELRADPEALQRDEIGCPEKVYINAAVEIVFRFIELPESYVVGADDRAVLGGGSIGGCVDSAERLRQRLDDKAVKYDLRDKPFAIVVGVRDGMCDVGDVHQALTGTSAVVIATGEGVRKGDGFFGYGANRRAGKHQRVSAVFSLHDWFPGGPYEPQLVRFDNPFATAPFSDAALPCGGRWGVTERGTAQIRAGWLTRPAARTRR